MLRDLFSMAPMLKSSTATMLKRSRSYSSPYVSSSHFIALMSESSAWSTCEVFFRNGRFQKRSVSDTWEKRHQNRMDLERFLHLMEHSIAQSPQSDTGKVSPDIRQVKKSRQTKGLGQRTRQKRMEQSAQVCVCVCVCDVLRACAM